MKKLIKVDEGFPCCRRYYYYSVHSYVCQQTNNLSVNEDIKYAELTKTDPGTRNS